MRKYIGLTEAWRPASEGERLLFLLLEHYGEWRVLRDALNSSALRIASRHQDLADFYIGSAVMHLLQRIVKQAGDIRDVESRRDFQVSSLKDCLVQNMGFSISQYGGDFGEFLDVAIRCAENAVRNVVDQVLSKKVYRACTADLGILVCYMCNRPLDVKDDKGNVLKATADHLWPASLGGNTTFENLLPSCESCNSTKLHVATWQMAWIQPAVYSNTSDTALRSVTRSLKIALHTRAGHEFAHANGTTLRDAFLAIGPREKYVTMCDPDETLDFFNMRVHDPVRTNINWMPK